MALVNSDLFLVQDSSTKTNYKVTLQTIADQIGGGDAPVQSVNGKTGTVVLSLPDLDDVEFANALVDKDVLTYNASTQKWNAVQPEDGGTAVEMRATPPSPATPGMMYWDTDNASLFIYYTDDNSSQWVPATPVPNAEEVDGGTY